MRWALALLAGYAASQWYREAQPQVSGEPELVPADTIIFFDADQDTGPPVSVEGYEVDEPTSPELTPQHRPLTLPEGF